MTHSDTKYLLQMHLWKYYSVLKSNITMNTKSFFFFSSQFNVFSVHEAVLNLASPFTATTQAWSLRKWVNVPFRLVQCSKGLQITFSAILEQITPFLMCETTFWRKLKVPCGCVFVSYYLLSAIDIGLKEKYMSSDSLSVPLLFINHHKL